MTTSERSSLHQYLSEQQIIWEPFTHSTHDRLAVTEIWRQHDTNHLHTIHQSILGQSLPHWLLQTNNTNQACLLRTIHIPLHLPTRHLNISAPLLHSVHIAFHHHPAFAYLQTQSAGINRLHDTSSDTETFHFCIHPKMAVTWSQEPTSNVIHTICIAHQPKLDMLRDLFEKSFVQELAHMEMLPALLCGIVCSREIDTAIERVKREIREVEVRRGFHAWAGRKEAPAKGDLEHLSVKMSGCGTRAASSRRKMEVLGCVNRFILERATRDGGSGSEDIVDVVGALERRMCMQRIDLDFVQCRAQNQKDALFHLIAANDAVSSRDIACDACHVATATQSDTQGMEALAIITVLFVPGAFLSSLFSTPLFEWQNDGEAGSSRLHVQTTGLLAYLGISCLLLLVTMLAWGFWVAKKGLERERAQQVKSRNGR